MLNTSKNQPSQSYICMSHCFHRHTPLAGDGGGGVCVGGVFFVIYACMTCVFTRVTHTHTHTQIHSHIDADNTLLACLLTILLYSYTVPCPFVCVIHTFHVYMIYHHHHYFYVVYIVWYGLLVSQQSERQTKFLILIQQATKKYIILIHIREEERKKLVCKLIVEVATNF